MDTVVRVNVTKEHIRQGRINKRISRAVKGCTPFSSYCPVALAMQDAGFDASVQRTYVIIRKSEKFPNLYDRDMIPHIDKVQKFVDSFDHDRKVKPFSFNVRIQKAG